MTKQADIIPTTMEHVEALSETMRACDRQEVWDSHHLSPLQALRISFLSSHECFTAVDEEGVICIFGVSQTSYVSPKGVPWMLGTDRLQEYPLQIVKETKKFIATWLKSFAYLENYVSEKNETSKRWLKWAGFTVEEPEVRGPEGKRFCKFYMWREYV